MSIRRRLAARLCRLYRDFRIWWNTRKLDQWSLSLDTPQIAHATHHNGAMEVVMDAGEGYTDGYLILADEWVTRQTIRDLDMLAARLLCERWGYSPRRESEAYVVLAPDRVVLPYPVI